MQKPRAAKSADSSSTPTFYRTRQAQRYKKMVNVHQKQKKIANSFFEAP
jgi:hypothetical protein